MIQPVQQNVVAVSYCVTVAEIATIAGVIMNQQLISVLLGYVDCVADVVLYCVTLVYSNLSSNGYWLKGLLNSTRGFLISPDPNSPTVFY